MKLQLGNVAVAKDPGGLGRARSVQVVEDVRAVSSTQYDLQVDAQDGDDVIAHGQHFMATDRDVRTETFFSKQKCSAIAVTLTANANLDQTAGQWSAPTWTGMVILVKGLTRNKEVSRKSD
jgi:hypothetical protein